MKCPSCGAAELIHDTRDVCFTYKGETTAISEVTGDYCPACGEIILDRVQGDIEALLIAMGAKVSEGSGSRVSFWHGVEEWHAHRPHPGKEAKKYQIEGVREFLERLEIKP